ncbi:hypothetical protein QYF36_000610 [Acer negundo]|nr:hypothetical protein QYF36_000610 [Acer negundo]
MALVANFDLELHQIDVKTAFLNSDIDETIYMVQPENFELGDPKNMVCKLTKSIYGLKQAYRQCGSKHIFLVLYVDDILLVTNDIGMLHETKRFLSKNFEMKDLSDASFDSKPGDTPVAKGDKFSLNQCPKNNLEVKEMQKIPYASAVGSLMYAQVSTRPDIAYIVGMLGRYLSNPGMDRWKATKRVMRYLQRTKDHMLTYRRSDQLEIIGYSDSDYVGCQDSRRSTSGYIYLLAGGAISWRSAKQTLIASSTMAA